MNIWMSGEIDSDVANAHREARKFIQSEVNKLMQDVSLSTSVVTWVYIAIIRSEASSNYAEVVKFNSKDDSLEFRLIVDHGQFKRSDDQGKSLLIIESLKRSIKLMGDLSVSDNDRSKLDIIIDKVKERTKGSNWGQSTIVSNIVN